MPITADLSRAARDSSVVFVSQPFADGLRVCGLPRLEHWALRPHQARFQVVAYVYAVDPRTLKGRLLTHVPLTAWGDAGAPGANVTRVAPPLEMHTVCFDVRKGHALALGVDMFDGLYEPSVRDAAAAVDLVYGAGSPPTLVLPVVAVET